MKCVHRKAGGKASELKNQHSMKSNIPIADIIGLIPEPPHIT